MLAQHNISAHILYVKQHVGGFNGMGNWGSAKVWHTSMLASAVQALQ